MIHIKGIVPCISLLKQHVRTILMMDPENYLINTSEQMNRSIDIILARENKSGSLTRHLISTLRGLMASSLSTQRDEAVDEAVVTDLAPPAQSRGMKLLFIGMLCSFI